MPGKEDPTELRLGVTPAITPWRRSWLEAGGCSFCRSFCSSWRTGFCAISY